MKNYSIALIFSFLFIAVLSCPVTSLANDSDIKIVVNNHPADLSYAPSFIDENNRTQVSLAVLADLLDFEYTFSDYRPLSENSSDAVPYTAALTANDLHIGIIEINIAMDDKTLYVNGYELLMDTVPIYRNDVFYVPLRFIAEAFDYVVEWDTEEYCVNIYHIDFDSSELNIYYYNTPSGRNDIIYPSVVKIRSVEELSAHYQNNMVFFDGAADVSGNRNTHRMENEIFLNADEFNEEFFNSRFLLFIVYEVSTGSSSQIVLSVHAEDFSTDIEIGNYMPETGTMDMVWHHVVLEMNRTLMYKEVDIHFSYHGIGADIETEID